MKRTKNFILTLLLFTDLEEYTGNIWAKTNMRKSFSPELFVPLVLNVRLDIVDWHHIQLSPLFKTQPAGNSFKFSEFRLASTNLDAPKGTRTPV